jgi:hypothetical protein
MSYTPYNQQTGEGGSRFGNFLRRNQGSMINSGISMLGGFIGAGNQHRRQRELMGLQHQNQRDLNQQGHELQMDMWNRTNYGAQVEHMKAAGLNPALMYGMSGGGGTTAGSQGGGSASGGQAQAWNPMDLSNMALMNAQKEKIEAETRNIDSGTELNEINRALNEHDYKWLKDKDLSRQSQTLVKGIADVTGDSFQKILGEIDNRVGKMLDVYKDPGKAIKEKAEAIKKAIEESAKAHGVMFKKAYDSWKNRFD